MKCKQQSRVHFLRRESPRGIVVNVLDCDIGASEFELQLRYYVHFQTNTPEKGMNHLFHQLWIK